ncbi:organic cation transporter protein [Folsomia candida]|uniref:organic cation transporter protein n=1 Tax=Folsomia candida TaxID=158441 RepID=UPI00160542B1|nr:organic cation transporter protein [Folsomia candida]
MTNSDEKKNDGFEKVYDYVGGSGWFQWRLLLITSLQLIIVTWHHIGYSFLGAVPDHWCKIEDLETRTNWTLTEIKRLSIPRTVKSDSGEFSYDKCHYYNLNYASLADTSESFEEAFSKTSYEGVEILECTQWDFDRTIYKTTIPSEFQLVCGRRWMTATIQSSYMAGGLVGTVFFGTVSDKFLGRRKTILISLTIVVVCGLAAAFAKSYWIFLLLRFFTSIGVSGSIQNCFVLVMEHADIKYRALLGMLEQIPFAIGYMILPLLAYFIRDWAMLQLSFGLISLTLVSYLWWVPESPRWLATHGNEEDSLKYLLRMAKVNKFPKPSKEALLEYIRQAHQQPPPREQEERVLENGEVNLKSASSKFKHRLRGVAENFKKLMSTAEIRKRSLVFWTIFLTVSMVYYGLVFSTNLTSDPFLLVFLGGLMEIPAYLLTPIPASKLGRRPTTCATFMLTGVCMLGLSQIDSSYETTRIVLAMLAKFFISSTFAIIYLLGAELYPTEMRTTGLAVGIFCGRLGGGSAPYIVDLLQHIGKDFASVIFGVSAVAAGLVALGLPETRVLEMADNVHEVEKQAVEIKEKRRMSRMSITDGLTQL